MGGSEKGEKLGVCGHLKSCDATRRLLKRQQGEPAVRSRGEPLCLSAVQVGNGGRETGETGAGGPLGT